ncbi:phosphoadenylyl-sulfate reductase [Mycobacterium sp. M1]|uniref:Phosphoadenosine 5'-phosphosulfate reductase n=1 Tax=Mycolicibacter acidiphilus TaxID=2835306 RepID=A0ABS5RJQ3_9MYCO|nr:phosphoadenylyl-sulfate reductase [Mycolicibacter acidiphilus]MBS9534528.1 phosphoadenylyl-sulfate reductase [Mycolicibacter acidiphilus]
MRSRTEEQLRELAERGAAELDGATATELLAWTDATFAGEWAAASNMQDAVLVDLAAKVRPGVDILFLDTGYHFPETIGTRDAVAMMYDVRLVTISAEQTVAEHEAEHGANLCARNAALQGRLRKVEPLRKALQGYSAWATGIRRVESWTRAKAPLISYDEQFGLVKVNPIAAWSDDEMDAYIAANGILVNPLVEEGYYSIGCQPCTSKPEPGADKRSGRWAGSTHTECGLHVPS